MSVFVGIDIAARSFDMAIRRVGKNGKAETFPQTAQGHARAIRKLQALRERMDELWREESPFADEVPEEGIHFIEPELVGEVGFTEWTRDGRLRHPRFLGLRRDKEPQDVVREDT